MKIDNCKLKINNKAFSLIELLVYVSIFAVVAGLMTSILTTVLKVNQRESASVETSEQLSFVMQTVSRLVRESSNIEIATSSASSALKLKLRMKDSAKDPTCLYLENQAIKLVEGPDAINPQNCNLNASSSLTSGKVIADKLDFSKISNYPGHDIVSIDIQLTYNSQNPQSQITRNLKSAIARVSAATFDSNLLPGSDMSYDLGFSPNTRWRNAAFSGDLLVNGNVGIGTAAPGVKLDVVGGVNGTNMFIRNSAGQTINYLSFWENTGNQWNIGNYGTADFTIWKNGEGLPALYLKTGGNVGIGTATPFSPGFWIDSTNSGLHIKGQQMAALLIEGGSGATISLYDQGAGINQKNVRLATDNGKTFFGTMNDNDTFKDPNVLVIDNNTGNVGIGTALIDSAKLLIKTSGGSRPSIKLYNDYIGNGDSPKSYYFDVSNNGCLGDVLVIGKIDGGSLCIPTNAIMTLGGNGNVGIGTTAPTAKLHVIGKGTFTGGIDPPYISFSDETHQSIRQYAKEVDEHEKVMQFWNGKTHRMEVYVIKEDKFYTITGEFIENQI